jgi:TolB protein
MTRSIQRAFAFAGLLGVALATRAVAQDTTYRGITLVGNYDPLRDKIAIAVLPVNGAFGDSVRTIIQRDLDFSDRFTIVTVDTSDPAALRGATGSGLNYPLFARLAATAVVQITPVAAGLHVSLHDVTRGQVVNVGEFALPGTALGRDWRMGIHQLSDEIERWSTGQKGIAATRVAYVRGTGIRIVDSDGADEITVPTEENGATPAWNLAATQLVYATFGPSSRLWTLDLASGRSRSLLGPARNIAFMSPVFTRDGSSILFGRATESGTDVYTIPAAGGDARKLTISRGADNSSPTASPDGRRVVYVGNQQGHPELYIMDADGTDAHVLTEYDFSEKNYRSDPDWSPDGRLIAYQERMNGRFQIRTIKVSGSTPRVLTSEGENEMPSWAPDSRHLVFTSTRTGVRQLWVLDTESNRLRQITKSSGSRYGSWSPRMPVP